MASSQTQRQMAVHYRLLQVEPASTLVMMAYDPVRPRNSKNQRRNSSFHTGRRIGFWTIPIHPDDQHKLAFTFGNPQYTFIRCPFGYSNSPVEFNIFLNKACPDARARANLVYVDNVLIKTSSVENNLKKIDHVLNQLTNSRS